MIVDCILYGNSYDLAVEKFINTNVDVAMNNFR